VEIVDSGQSGNPGRAGLRVMNEILGGGFGSRLFQKVRTELGLAYAVDGRIRHGLRPSRCLRAEVLTKSPSTVDATQRCAG